MQFERFSVKTCCGGSGIALKLAIPISGIILPLLTSNGFTLGASFHKAGIFYAENEDLIATGAYTSNILQIKCKKRDCINFITVFEELLANMG